MIKFELADIDDIVKKNNIKQVTNPALFRGGNRPTPDGLLSNEIFGTTPYERRNLMGYIDLNGKFMHPYLYRVWSMMDSSIRKIVHGQGSFSLNNRGYIIESRDGKGETGIDFLIRNINRINIQQTDSRIRRENIKLIMSNKDKMFITKQLVIPAFYRDVHTDKGFVGVGEINELYIKLINAANALGDMVGYGFEMANATKGRIQEILLEIYNYFADEPNIRGKHGVMRRAVMNKTADYSTRLVISAPNIDYDRPEDMLVNLDYSAVPLASLCVNFFPFILFYIRRFFQNEFSAGLYPYTDKGSNELKYVRVKDPDINFSDDVITNEINNFIDGFSNRFKPIRVPTEDGKNIWMRFKGRRVPAGNINNPGNSPLLDRRLTWCDIIFMAAHEMTRDKHILITRFPLEDHFGQFTTKITVASTIETEPMFIGNSNYYNNYPKIREKDIGKDTSNDFIDTLQISNLHLDSIGGDYDGDMCTVKGVFTNEANAELEKHMNSLTNYIGLDGTNVRITSNESVQAIYNLTKVLSGTELIDPRF